MIMIISSFTCYVKARSLYIFFIGVGKVSSLRKINNVVRGDINSISSYKLVHCLQSDIALPHVPNLTSFEYYTHPRTIHFKQSKFQPLRR